MSFVFNVKHNIHLKQNPCSIWNPKIYTKFLPLNHSVLYHFYKLSLPYFFTKTVFWEYIFIFETLIIFFFFGWLLGKRVLKVVLK